MLSVGVSTYKYRRQEDCLEFAHQDAIDFTKAMLRQKGKLYQDVISSELPNEQATREQVIEGFEWLRQNTTVNDVAMIFMAGHGLNDKWGGYLFLPYDFREEKAATTVSQSELAYYLKNIYGKALFFLDTCHAGALAGAFRGARDIDINGLVNDLKSAENGMIVFASCAGKERSMESSTWQHGCWKGWTDAARTGKTSPTWPWGDTLQIGSRN